MIFNLHERLKSIRPRNYIPKDFVSWHSPSNAHAYRLLIFKELRGLRCVAESLSAEKGDFDLFSKPCQAVSHCRFKHQLKTPRLPPSPNREPARQTRKPQEPESPQRLRVQADK